MGNDELLHKYYNSNSSMKFMSNKK